MPSGLLLEAAVSRLAAWMGERGFKRIERTGNLTPDVCMRAVGRGGVSVAVLRPRMADGQAYRWN